MFDTKSQRVDHVSFRSGLQHHHLNYYVFFTFFSCFFCSLYSEHDDLQTDNVSGQQPYSSDIYFSSLKSQCWVKGLNIQWLQWLLTVNRSKIPLSCYRAAFQRAATYLGPAIDKLHYFNKLSIITLAKTRSMYGVYVSLQYTYVQYMHAYISIIWLLCIYIYATLFATWAACKRNREQT